MASIDDQGVFQISTTGHLLIPVCGTAVVRHGDREIRSAVDRIDVLVNNAARPGPTGVP
ncbi:hypothetical protein ABZS66_00975 [Dactylosporangium sp. NPDC005572]|uniref:hypothetical protein n=1 Tax=Dactylosporangium sp. NPDC005572 TaxID=3156889 RepID=UPI0033A78EFD